MKRISHIIIGVVVVPLVAVICFWGVYKFFAFLLPYTVDMGYISIFFQWLFVFVIEKFSSIILCGIVAFVAYRIQDESVQIKIFIALISSLVFQGILVLRWIVLWGYFSYMQYNRPLSTFIGTIVFALAGAGMAYMLEGRKSR